MELKRFVAFISILIVISTMLVFRSCQTGNAQIDGYYFDFGNEAVNSVTGLTVDPSGCWYMCGTTEGILEGNGYGSTDFYVSKFDSSGNQLWIKQYGTGGDDYAECITADSTGKVYICGSTTGDLYAQNAAFGVNDSEAEDAFIASINPNDGSIIWGVQTGTSMGDQFNNIKANGQYLYVTGGSGGSLYASNTHFASIIIGKYQNIGTLIWGQQMTSLQGASVAGIDLDSQGNIYICGSSADLFGISSGGGDSIVAKLNSSGNLLWGRMYGTSNNDGAESIRLASDGSIYVLETINSTDETGQGSSVRLNKLNLSGISIWTREINSTAYKTGTGKDFATDLALDSMGNAYIAGFTDGNIFSINNGKLDTWVAKYNSSGDKLWSYQFGSSGEEDEMLLASIPNNRLLVAGRSGLLQNVDERDSEADIYLRIFEPVSIPTYSPAGGTYSQALTVTLSTSASGSTIHYTTDGSEPNEQSQTYSGPIVVSQTTTIKAQAWEEGKITSNTAAVTYVIE